MINLLKKSITICSIVSIFHKYHWFLMSDNFESKNDTIFVDKFLTWYYLIILQYVCSKGHMGRLQLHIIAKGDNW